MKTLALSLFAFLAASLPLSSAMGDEAAALGPPPGMAETLRCLLREGPKGCEKMFVGRASLSATPLILGYSAEADFQRGAFVSSTYWGMASDSNILDHRALKFLAKETPTAIVDVKFAHKECTFYISPPDPDGKIRALTVVVHAPHDLAQIRDWGPCL